MRRFTWFEIILSGFPTWAPEHRSWGCPAPAGPQWDQPGSFQSLDHSTTSLGHLGQARGELRPWGERPFSLPLGWFRAVPRGCPRSLLVADAIPRGFDPSPAPKSWNLGVTPGTGLLCPQGRTFVPSSPRWLLVGPGEQGRLSSARQHFHLQREPRTAAGAAAKSRE